MNILFLFKAQIKKLKVLTALHIYPSLFVALRIFLITLDKLIEQKEAAPRKKKVKKKNAPKKVISIQDQKDVSLPPSVGQLSQSPGEQEGISTLNEEDGSLKVRSCYSFSYLYLYLCLCLYLFFLILRLRSKRIAELMCHQILLGV